ncbi:MAG: glycosyltransferase family 39 protein [Bacteroidota bacterium]
MNYPLSEFVAKRARSAAAVALFLASFVFLIYLSHHFSPTGLNHDEAYLINLARQLAAGNGFVTPVLWQLYLDPDALPMPYGGTAGPLPSILIAACILLFGESFFVMQLPGMLLGSLIAPLTFLLGNRLGLSEWRAFAAGGVTAIHPFLAYNANEIMTDVPFAAFILLSFLLLYSRSTAASNIALGVSWGLAYLCRYQATLFIVVLIAAWKVGKQRSLRDIAIATGAFVVTAFPWFVRNMLVFGNPLFTYASRYFWLIAHVPEQVQIVRRTTPPPDQISFLLGNLNVYVSALLGRVKALMFYARDALAPNAALGLGLLVVLFRERREWRIAFPILVYGVIVTLFFLTSYLEPRYLLSLAPFLVIGGVGGLAYLNREHDPPWRFSRLIEPGLVIAVICAYMVVDSIRLADTEGRASFHGRAETAYNTREFFQEFPPWSFAIMATAPEHFALFHNQYAVSFPFDVEKDLQRLTAKYRVRFVVLQDDEAEQFERVLPVIGGTYEKVFRARNAHVYEAVAGKFEDKDS